MPHPQPAPASLKRASGDLLIVGSGVAGLRAAIEAAAAGLSVVLLAKDSASDSNTDKAQGGIAVALSDEDEVGLHHRDTIAAGDGLCDEEAVRALVEEGPRYITQLIEWGAQFDREGSRLHFTREGAHSARRVLHAQGDSTGQEILRALLSKAYSMSSIEYLPNTYTVDLYVENGRCVGLLCLDEREGRLSVVRGTVLLAAGGCGQVYRETTNPPQATGDGIAMAFRAGAWVRDMEFVQFHPTSLAVSGAPRFLLSEALRGEGAYLRNASGKRFMIDVDPRRAELAPRDVVARAIANEIAVTGEPVYLDLTHLGLEYPAKRFPRIHRTCLGYGIDIGKDRVPVSPSAHYMMGGVATDLWGRTSIPGLYAAGEVACNGVHGANRLASNSLLEGLVFGARAGQAAVEDRSSAPGIAEGKGPGSVGFRPDTGTGRAWDPPRCEIVAAADAVRVTGQVKEITWSRVGIIRDREGLGRARDELSRLAAPAPSTPVTRAGVESRNIQIVAHLIAAAALIREESRGAHFRTDFPERDDARFRRPFLLGPGMEVGTLSLGATGSGIDPPSP